MVVGERRNGSLDPLQAVVVLSCLSVSRRDLSPAQEVAAHIRDTFGQTAPWEVGVLLFNQEGLKSALFIL